MKISGIYKIINKINNNYYIGSSNNICGRRWNDHRFDLERNQHFNDHLQKAWNKYGKNNFEWVIVENVSQEKLLLTEQKYLNIARTEKQKCYNQSFVAGKVDMTPETRRKIGLANRGKNNGNYGKKLSKEIRLRMSLSRTGPLHPLYGKHHTEESKRKNSESNKIAQRGEKNGRYNPSVFTFVNIKTKKVFRGTQYNFYTTFQLNNVFALVKGRQKSVKGWVLVNPHENNYPD